MSPRLQLSASVAAIALAVAFPASAETGKDIVEDWIAGAESVEWLEVGHSGIAHDAGTDVTTISNLSVRVHVSPDTLGIDADDPDDTSLAYTISFPTITFTGLDMRDGYYEADSIAAPSGDLTLDLSGVPQADQSTMGRYENLQIDGPRWAVPPAVADDPERPISRFYPLLASLVDVSFSSASAGSVAITTQSSEPAFEQTILYGAMTVGVTESGNMSELVVDGIRMSMRGGDEMPPFDVATGPITAQGYNYGDIIRVFEPGRRPVPGNPYRPGIDRIAVSDLRINAEEATMRIGEIAMEEFDYRQPSIDVLSEADRLYLEAEQGDAEPDEEEIIQLVVAIYAAFRLGRVEMADFAVSSEEVNGRLASTGYSDLSADGIGEIWLSGLDLTGSNGEVVKWSEFVISGVGFPSIDALVGFEEAEENGDIETMLAAIPTVNRIASNGMVVNIPNEGQFALESSSTEMDGHIGPIPTRVSTDLVHARMPVDQLDSEARTALRSLGYEEIDVSYGLDLEWVEADSALDIAVSASLAEGGDLAIDGRIAGIPRSVFENPLTAEDIAPFLTLVGANARFDDNSVTERALDMIARDQGSDVETVKAQALGILPFALAGLQRPDFMTMVTGVAKTFLEAPGSLTLTIAPVAPVPLLQIAAQAESDPGSVVDILGITVEAD